MSFEDRLRTDLHAAAERGVEERRIPPAPDVTSARPRRATRRRLVLVAAVAIVAAAGAGVAFVVGGSGGPEPEASCVAALEWHGDVYYGRGAGARVPELGDPLGEAHQAGCDDVNPGEGDEDPGYQVPVFALRDLDPTVAIVSESGDVYLSSDITVLPQALRDLDRQVPCEGDGPSRVTGQLLGFTTGFTAATRPDTHGRPFSMHLRSTTLVPGYASVTVAIRFPDVEQNRANRDLFSQAVGEVGDVTVDVHCRGPRFVADSITAVR